MHTEAQDEGKKNKRNSKFKESQEPHPFVVHSAEQLVSVYARGEETQEMEYKAIQPVLDT